MNQIKKISVAKVFGKIALSKLMASPGQTLDVMQVIGVGVGTKTGDSDYGDWTALLGTFEATNPETGEVYSSATVFLPDVALIPLQVALASGAKGVQFAIMVMVSYVAEKPGAKTGGSPYEYSFRPLIKPDEESDPIALIKRQMAAALPAPIEKPAEETPPVVNASKRKQA